LGNSGLIAGAFSSTSGKADTVLDTNGQILYYNNGRKALDKEDNDDVLTLKSGLPSWEAAASGGANTALSNLSSVAVNATIDMNSNILTNVKAGVGYAKLEQLEFYEEASATGDTKTFTLTEDNLDLYDCLILTYNLISSASFDLEIVVDALTSGYAYSVSEDSAGTFSNTSATSQSECVVMDTTLINTENLRIQGQILFMPAEQNEGDDLCDLLFQGGIKNRGNAWGCCTVEPFDSTSMGSITVATSTSSWKIHSTMNLMGRRK
jgi:hypothetical protein